MKAIIQYILGAVSLDSSVNKKPLDKAILFSPYKHHEQINLTKDPY